MKGFSLHISIAPKAERPFPAKEILWGSQEGGQTLFPTAIAAYERKYSNDPVPMQKFSKAVANAQERIWIVDEYLLIPDSGKPARRIEQILTWLPLWLAASDIRLLTKHHQEIDEDDLKKFQLRAQAISNQAVRREKECRIEIRGHLTRDCDFVHDRFAIIDDELWHFGGTVGGFHSKVSAASRGWRASEHGAISFFEEIWNAGERK
ncbi:hypothetical protein E8Q33_03510 [Methylophaga sp. SB9B]|uniref:hypothetical protein n=1 Tax=Methylophaga sp. SB9B TaxID=2570356 RepID=UPI0010A792A0|nr:hypothetical protein [Methylophaga sp. SB9B]THK42607.1 hypothetical protein E8Q33_03510 [Methylophaga sp. SB9B]